MNKKSKSALMVFIGVPLFLMARVYYVGVIEQDDYRDLAKQNTIKTEYFANARGSIFDVNGNLLALNRLGFEILVDPHLGDKKRDGVLAEIVKIMPRFDVGKLTKQYERGQSAYNHQPIKVIDLVDYKYMIDKYAKLNFVNHVTIQAVSKRGYPYKSLAAHVIGYTSSVTKYEISKRDKIHLNNLMVGKAGVEKFYEDFLRGEINFRRYLVNARNEELEQVEQYLSSKNTNITLTLDTRLQRYIHNYFVDSDYKGVALVMDVRDGSLLAAVSAPEYDLNLFANGISKAQWQRLINDINNPFTNKLINGLYPPGSILKMGVALSFLEHKVLPKKSVFDTGEYIFANQKFRCWRPRGHGRVNLSRAIKESCDDYFYKMSYEVGIDKMATTLRALGLGQKTLVDLPNEFIGTVPDKLWKQARYGQNWYIGETFISSIGQGYNLVTPMQIVQHMGVLATGKKVVPHFLKKLGNYEIQFDPIEEVDPVHKKHLPTIRHAMYRACNEKRGTGYKYVVHSKYTLACKTGTAQVSRISQDQKKRLKESELDYLKRSHAWFSAFFPYKNPKYAIVALIEHGGYGSRVGEVVADVANYMNRLGIIE